jgi:hypothetical protein
MFETFEGGITNKEVSKLARDVSSMTKLVHDIRNPAASPFGKPTTSAPPDEKKTSILGELFKDLRKQPDGTFGSAEPKKEGV